MSSLRTLRTSGFVQSTERHWAQKTHCSPGGTWPHSPGAAPPSLEGSIAMAIGSQACCPSEAPRRTRRGPSLPAVRPRSRTGRSGGKPTSSAWASLAHEIQKAAERRALALARAGGGGEESRRAAALEFLASSVIALRQAGASARQTRGDSFRMRPRPSASRAAQPTCSSSCAPSARRMWRSCRRSPRSRTCSTCSSSSARPTASRCGGSPRRPLGCLAAAGQTATTRRLRDAARAAARERASRQSHVRLPRPGRPGRALGRAFRGARRPSAPGATGRLLVYLGEAAAALSPAFEREMLFERNVDPRTLPRLRCRALGHASGLRPSRRAHCRRSSPSPRIFASPVGSSSRASRSDDRDQVAGRFDDLEARLASLDRSLRDIAHGMRATSRARTAARADAPATRWRSSTAEWHDPRPPSRRAAMSPR